MKNRQDRRHAPRLSAFAALSALLLSACGGGGGDTEGGVDGEEQVFVASTGNLPTLNPQFVSDPSVQQVGGAMLEPLVRITDEYEIVPWLAQDWEISEDGLEVTFHLEEGVEWHDGEPFTSEDVAFNFEEIMELDTFGADFVDVIDTVEAPDEHTVVLHMEEPYGALLEALALQYILPEHIYAGTEYLENEANSEPVGTGPLVFDSYSEGESAELVRNENYWGGAIEVDRVIFAVSTDPNARDLSLLAGDLDRADFVGSTRMDEIMQNPDLETTMRGVLPQQAIFVLNTETPELADPEVRQLVYAAIDKEQLVTTAMPEVSEIPTGIYPPALEWSASDEIDFSQDFAYDVEAINAGLDAAGYPVGDDGYRFSLRYHYMSNVPDTAAIGEVMQSSLDEVGIQLVLEGYDTNVYTELVYEQRDFDTAVQLTSASSDPSLGITRWYTCNEEGVPHRNPSGVCDDQIEDAARGALVSPGQEERAEHLQALEERAAELMIAAPLVFANGVTVYNTSRWQGQDYPDGLTGGTWHNIEPAGG